MTITKGSSGPLFVVLGSTGNQGSSVVKALEESYASNPVLKKYESAGAKVIIVDVSTQEGAEKALKDADIAFALTLTGESEFSQGKALMDAAAACGVKNVIYTGMVNIGKLAGYSAPIWDIKAEVAYYGRSLNAFKVHDVSTGSFFTNLLTQNAPRKKPDGSFVIAIPYSLDTPIPFIDVTVNNFFLF